MEQVSLPELSFLVIGDSGTGKTNFIRTLPRPFVFDFDKGMATLEGTGIPYQTFKDAPKGAKILPFMKDRGIYEWGTAWPAAMKHLSDIGTLIDKGECPYDSLCFDSLTLMSDLCMNNILKNSGKDKPEIQHWGAFLHTMGSIMDQITSWPLIKYLTAHVQRETNDLTQTVEMLPLISGQMKGKISIYFDEIYFAEVTGGVQPNSRREYVFRTQSTTLMKQARSRRGVPDRVAQDFRTILSHINKK
jgi:hypothetical protein